jgi:hypothetical protein
MIFLVLLRRKAGAQRYLNEADAKPASARMPGIVRLSCG